MGLIVLTLLIILLIAFIVVVLLTKKAIYGILAAVSFAVIIALIVYSLTSYKEYYCNPTISIISINEVYTDETGGYYAKKDDKFYALQDANICLGDDNYIIKKVYPNMKKSYSAWFEIHKTNYTIVTKSKMINKFPKMEELK